MASARTEEERKTVSYKSLPQKMINVKSCDCTLVDDPLESTLTYHGILYDPALTIVIGENMRMVESYVQLSSMFWTSFGSTMVLS